MGLLDRIKHAGFRPQKTRLQIDWMTNTDERIMQRLRGSEPQTPAAIASDLERSAEYVADRCRQLAIRELLVQHESGEYRYALAALGERYLDDEISVEELEER
ncbi:phage repressor protein [Natronorarus salvus]|uniref:phage repressor protein n=1 Tax=Natronorarus salvus TaxID=3117733 RepID=UPI002F2679FD